MFTVNGLFKAVPCPDGQQCKRLNCLFSHMKGATQPSLPVIPIVTTMSASPTSNPRSIPALFETHSLIPSKRPATVMSSFAVVSHAGQNPGRPGEPPSKLQKLSALPKKMITAAAHTSTSTEVPTLNINAAQSQVAIPVRQAMLKTLHEHFKALYSDILLVHPNLASEHALLQEQEIYAGATKHTYRNAVITFVASLKKRQKPDCVSHDSVGTEQTIQRRKEQQYLIQNLRLSRNNLSAHIMSTEEMEKWDYMLKVPEGPGSHQPSDEGKVKLCERCKEQFVVKRRENADECVFHWGKPYTTRINGERIRAYRCCSRPVSETEGCDKGPHVFYEIEQELLHGRHAFSLSRPPCQPGDNANTSVDTALDVVALDCEMIYTTGGMSIARVSVVDGAGKELLDEFVRLDDDVEIIDFNTKFSGITEELYSKAALQLAAIRRSLDAFINSETVIIGHALENDLKALRMIHHCCVDTAVLFPHRSGHPYRRALRDLAREHLNEIIQAGGAKVGHSSMEDAMATLNLVRWYLINNDKITLSA